MKANVKRCTPHGEKIKTRVKARDCLIEKRLPPAVYVEKGCDPRSFQSNPHPPGFDEHAAHTPYRNLGAIGPGELYSPFTLPGKVIQTWLPNWPHQARRRGIKDISSKSDICAEQLEHFPGNADADEAIIPIICRTGRRVCTADFCSWITFRSRRPARSKMSASDVREKSFYVLRRTTQECYDRCYPTIRQRHPCGLSDGFLSVFGSHVI